MQLALLAFLGLIAAVVVLGLRWRDQEQRDTERQRWRLRFPADLGPEAVIAALGSLSGLPHARHAHQGDSTLVFEVVATAEGIEHRLSVPSGQADFVIGEMRVALPGLGVTTIANEHHPPAKQAVELRLTDRGRELRAQEPAAASAALLAALRPLVKDERVVIQWVIAPAAPYVVPQSSGKSGRQPSAWWERLGRPARWPADAEAAKAAREKLALPVFSAVGRVAVSAPSPERAAHVLWRVVGVLHSLRRPGVAIRRRWLPSATVGRRVRAARTPLVRFPLTLNARELAVVIAWPYGDLQLPGLAIGGSRLLPPDSAIPSEGRVIGESTFPGAERPIAVSAQDSTHHVVVTGPTGAGKSTLLANLILGDIAAGRGLVAIDPKGDLVADVLDRIPLAHADRVVLLDPTDDQRPVGLNLLHGAHQAPELVTDQALAIFKHMYASYWGVRIQDVLHSSLITLSAEPGWTLTEVPLLLTNDEVRRRLVARLDDPIGVKPFWAWYEQLKPAERGQALAPVLSRLRPLLLRRRVRNIVGQVEPTFTLGEVLSAPKVLLVSLAEGLLGPEAAALVGALVVAQLWQAIQGRAALAPARRHPVSIVLDEFQAYVALPTNLADVMARARGYGASLHLSHQHLAQLPSDLRLAVAANARSRIAFQSAADDAQTLARQLGGGLQPEDLQRLEAFHIYAAIYAGGRVRSPVSARTFAMPPALGTAEAIRARSRQRYGRDRAEVEAAIQARHSLSEDDGPVGRARRRP